MNIQSVTSLFAILVQKTRRILATASLDRLRACARVWMAAVLCLLWPTAGWTQDRQVLRDHLPVAIAKARPVPLGLLERAKRVNLAIGLPLRNQEALTKLLNDLHDPASPDYGKYLTPAEFTERFGPTPKDYQTVIDWAKKNGLTVTATHPNRVIVDVEGPVTAIEKALNLTMQTYQHPTEARTFYAPDREPSLDLAVPILHISGLDNYSLPHPNLKPRPAGMAPNATSNAGSGPGGSYGGGDFRAAYTPGTTLTGTGQSVGLLQFDGYYASDITAYRTQFGLPNIPLTNVAVDGGVSTPGGGNGEVCLDIETVMAMAPGLSRIYVYMAPNPSPWVDLLSRMANDNLSRQLSCSWGGGGPDASAETIFQQMAAQGQSFFNATGDSDAFTSAIEFPSESPNITQVGATTLTTSGPGGTYVSETVWNWGGGTGSSGGISTVVSIPTWQQGISMVANQGSTIRRNVPDVALTGDNVHVKYGNGSSGAFGGTSCAAPLWAGLTALINQQAAANGRSPVGLLNAALYSIGKGATYTTNFHDTTNGNNFSSASPSRFSAVTGFDLCTGWGTPTTALIAALSGSAPVITTQPASTSINSGQTATLSVVASGTGLSYQWYQGTSPSTTTPVGTNLASYTTPALSATTSYWVKVSNSGGFANSNTATVTVGTLLQPNLTPYKPGNWSDKIVVSTVTGTNTDSPTLLPTDTLYVDWQVNNVGTGATTVRFFTEIYVDGVLKTSWYSDPPLNAGSGVYVTDYSIGSLPVGTHTIHIKADSTNVIAESDEGDNDYTKTITVGNPALPNLTPYQPAGWSDKIVVSNATGTNTDSSPLLATDTLYLDYAVLNNGTAATSGSFQLEIDIDGTLFTTLTHSASLAAGAGYTNPDVNLGSLAVGTHTIGFKIDFANTILESSETDNEYTKTITVVSPPPGPPVITSPLTAPPATTGQPFNYQITATNNPTSYSATVSKGSLPPGLSVNTTTGLISGTPTQAGTFIIPISATNAAGTGAGDLILTSQGLALEAFQVVRDSYAARTLDEPYFGGRHYLYSHNYESFQFRSDGSVVSAGTATNEIYDSIYTTQAGYDRKVTHAEAIVSGVGKYLVESDYAANNPLDGIGDWALYSPYYSYTLYAWAPPTSDGTYPVAGYKIWEIKIGSSPDIRVTPLSLSLSKTTNPEIYVEIDWMEDGTHSHKPSQAVIDRIVAAFARDGFTIHIDVSNAIPHQAVLAVTNSPSGSAAIQAIRNANFNHIADTRYFYSIWCHDYDAGRGTGSSGIADLPGRIHLVSLGSGPGQTGTADQQVGTFVHEFGHNMNQLHGGTDSWNYKPNYVSVMNYYFQFQGIGPTLFAMGWATSSSGFNDFGYSHGTLPDLDENHLNETVGIGLGKAVDWNGNGNTAETDIAYDVNYDVNQPSPRSILTDFDNWGAIGGYIRNGILMPNLGIPPNPSETCISVAEAAANEAILTKLRASRGPDPAAFIKPLAAVPTNGFTIFNDGSQPLVVSAITPATAAPWLTVSPTFPMTIPPGGSRNVAVAADYTLAPVGTTTTRLLIQSNDPDENPYPGGLNVIVSNPTP